MARRAFTLIELMVVISVLVLISGIAIPNVMAIQNANATRSKVEAVRRLPFQARIRAREDGQTVVLRYESGNAELTLARDEQTSTFQTRMSSDENSGDAVLESVSLGENIIVNAIEPDDTTRSSDEVRFYPDGTADRATIRLLVNNGPRYLRIDKDGTASWVPEPPAVQDERWDAGELETRAAG